MRLSWDKGERLAVRIYLERNVRDLEMLSWRVWMSRLRHWRVSAHISPLCLNCLTPTAAASLCSGNIRAVALDSYFFSQEMSSIEVNRARARAR